MNLPYINLDGSLRPEGIAASDQVFSATVNTALVHQVLVAYQAYARAGTKAQKSRSQVRGGGRKPWQQKGTGRARAGTSRSPLWRGGGVTFAATPRDYQQKVNKKMYRSAMRSIFSSLAASDQLHVIDSAFLNIDQPKTKLAVDLLNKLSFKHMILVAHDITPNLYLATRNLHRFQLMDFQGLNPLDLMNNNDIVLTEPMVRTIEGWLA